MHIHIIQNVFANKISILEYSLHEQLVFLQIHVFPVIQNVIKFQCRWQLSEGI